MINILIVEDEEAISNLIKMSLTKAGYHCEQAMDGIAAADCIEQSTYDLILLDVMLPGLNGYELLDFIKTIGTPVIFITAMGSVEDRVKGLRSGADDYITKPFEMIELLARVETVLRRYHKADDKLEVFDIQIDISSRQVWQKEKPVSLTMKEFDLLLFFVRNKNIALYRETIYENIWGSDFLEKIKLVGTY